MNQDQKTNHIRSQYNIIGTIYSSKYFQPDGEKYLHDSLSAFYRSVYEKNDRILVVQDCVDSYDYENFPGRFIVSLQTHIWRLDISNCYVLLLTSNKDIDLELNEARQRYSNDVTCIEVEMFSGEYQKSINQTDSFCVLPWIHLYIGTDGNILPCCLADHRYPMGNIELQSIDDIMLSSRYNTLRKDLLSGKRRKECQRCYEKEDLGLPSERIDHNRRWGDVKSTDLRDDGSIVEFRPRYLDIRLSNLCNLKCRMCSGYFSSAIAQEEVELFGNTSTTKSTLRSQARKSNLTKVLDHVSSIEKIYFAGGEPLLATEHYEILDALIRCGNTNLEITYNTNFTTLKYRDRDVLDLWKHFKNVTVGASLDAEHEVAEYVRHGTNWQDIETNLEKLQAQCPQVNFTVTSTVGMLNASSLIDLQRRWHESGKLDISKFSMTTMIGPDHLTVCALPENHKKRLDILINDHVIWCESKGAEKIVKSWKDVLSYMWAKDSSHNLDEFRRLTKILDGHRKESLIAVLPEYKDLI